MKKLILCLALLSGCFTVSEVIMAAPTTDGPVCPANAPCLYQGKAKSTDGYTLTISVHRLDNTSTDLVAKFYDGGEQTAYVFPSGNGDGKWYFNWGGRKYWFEM